MFLNLVSEYFAKIFVSMVIRQLEIHFFIKCTNQGMPRLKDLIICILIEIVSHYDISKVLIFIKTLIKIVIINLII